MRVVGLAGASRRCSELGYVQLGVGDRERSHHISCFRSLRVQGPSSNKPSQVIGICRAILYRWQKHLEEGGIQRAGGQESPAQKNAQAYLGHRSGTGSPVSQGPVFSLGQG